MVGSWVGWVILVFCCLVCWLLVCVFGVLFWVGWECLVLSWYVILVGCRNCYRGVVILCVFVLGCWGFWDRGWCCVLLGCVFWLVENWVGVLGRDVWSRFCWNVWELVVLLVVFCCCWWFGWWGFFVGCGNIWWDVVCVGCDRVLVRFVRWFVGFLVYSLCWMEFGCGW